MLITAGETVQLIMSKPCLTFGPRQGFICDEKTMIPAYLLRLYAKCWHQSVGIALSRHEYVVPSQSGGISVPNLLVWDFRLAAYAVHVFG